MQTKKCPKCGLDKAVTEFHKKTLTRDGLYPYCKPCVKILRAEAHTKRPKYPPDLSLTEKYCWGHKENHPIEAFGKDAKYPDGYRQYCRAWNNEQKKLYDEAHPEAVAAAKALWAQSEAGKEAGRLYSALNREKKRERAAKHYEDNREAKLLYASEYQKSEQGKAVGARARHTRRDRMATCDYTTAWLFEQRAAATDCARCKATLTRDDHLAPTYITLEHIIPLNDKGGGLNVMANLAFTCRQCNSRRPKDGRDIVLWASNIQTREVALFLA